MDKNNNDDFNSLFSNIYETKKNTSENKDKDEKLKGEKQDTKDQSKSHLK